MFRRKRQFGLRRKRYRTPFTGSSYLYAADMEYRGRAVTLACGPVAVGEVIITPVEWKRDGAVIAESDVAVPMTYPMIARLLCDQGAPRTLGISGWATGYVQRVKIDADSYFRQWCTEFVTRVVPSLLNILDTRGVADLYRLKLIGEVSFLDAVLELRDVLSGDILSMPREAVIDVTRRIWSVLEPVRIEGPTAAAYVHIPFTYLARSKPPRAVQRRGVWVFAKSQLRHELSEKAQEKGLKKYGVRSVASVFNQGYMVVEDNLLGRVNAGLPGAVGQ